MSQTEFADFWRWLVQKNAFFQPFTVNFGAIGESVLNTSQGSEPRRSSCCGLLLWSEACKKTPLALVAMVYCRCFCIALLSSSLCLIRPPPPPPPPLRPLSAGVAHCISKLVGHFRQAPQQPKDRKQE